MSLAAPRGEAGGGFDCDGGTAGGRRSDGTLGGIEFETGDRARGGLWSAPHRCILVSSREALGMR